MSKTTSSEMSPGLEHILAANPEAQFYLLIRVTEADDPTEQALRDYGVTIRHRLTLVPTFAVTCTGAAALSLMQCSWVEHIEDDRPVHTM